MVFAYITQITCKSPLTRQNRLRKLLGQMRHALTQRFYYFYFSYRYPFRVAAAVERARDSQM